MLYLYYPNDIDYIGILKDEEYDPAKPFAKLVMGPPQNNPFLGVVFTEASEKELSPNEAEDRNLMLVTQAETDLDINNLQIVDVTVGDLFNPHSRMDGKTVCAAISSLTNQTLSSLSYVVNGEPNPRFVMAECIDIHAKVQLGKTISRKAEDIMNLMDDSEYEAYCGSRVHEGDREKCEVVEPWMKAGPSEEPRSICQLTQGRFFSTNCSVNKAQRDRIKKYLSGKINECIGNMGCITDTSRSGKFARRHTKKNFPNGIPTNICCKRSLKAVVKAAMRMDRLYKIVGNMSFAEQMDMINSSSMSASEKKAFLENVQKDHSAGDKLVADMELDRPTQILMEAFSIVVRNALRQEMEKFVMLSSMMPSAKSDDEAKKALNEIMGEEKASGVMDMLRSAASSVVNVLMTASGLLLKAVRYFAQKGFDLMMWIFHHPTTALWLSYSALLIKKKLCNLISLKIHGDPQIIEVGFYEKSRDLFEKGGDLAGEYAQIVKRSFLTYAYNFVDSASFQGYISTLETMIETGILYVLALIPGFGLAIAGMVKSSGGLRVVLKGLGAIMSEATYYAITTMVIKEAGNDMFEILTGTCIKPPEPVKQMSTAAIAEEAKGAANYVGSAFDLKTKTGESYFDYLFQMAKTVK